MNCLQETIRHSSALCAGEQQYIDRRKEIVLQALNNLQINCNAVRKTYLHFSLFYFLKGCVNSTGFYMTDRQESGLREKGKTCNKDHQPVRARSQTEASKHVSCFTPVRPSLFYFSNKKKYIYYIN